MDGQTAFVHYYRDGTIEAPQWSPQQAMNLNSETLRTCHDIKGHKKEDYDTTLNANATANADSTMEGNCKLKIRQEDTVEAELIMEMLAQYPALETIMTRLFDTLCDLLLCANRHRSGPRSNKRRLKKELEELVKAHVAGGQTGRTVESGPMAARIEGNVQPQALSAIVQTLANPQAPAPTKKDMVFRAEAGYVRVRGHLQTWTPVVQDLKVLISALRTVYTWGRKWLAGAGDRCKWSFGYRGLLCRPLWRRDLASTYVS
jgi:hypothetical protein